jgi:hypothetical protein
MIPEFKITLADGKEGTPKVKTANDKADKTESTGRIAHNSSPSASLAASTMEEQRCRSQQT